MVHLFGQNWLLEEDFEAVIVEMYPLEDFLVQYMLLGLFSLTEILALRYQLLFKKIISLIKL